MAHIEIPNSTYLDYTSAGLTDATTVAAAYKLAGSPTPAFQTINVALTLPRATDPTPLLESDWATRQATLSALEAAGTLWTTYGASPVAFANAVAALGAMGIPVLGLAGDDGYLSSAASRTIWVTLDPAKFEALFGTKPFQAGAQQDGGLYYWNGNLSLPDDVPAEGIWFDTAPIRGPRAAVSDQSGGAAITPADGPLSIGNALAPLGPGTPRQESRVFAGDMADWYYNFPLQGIAAPTPTIGLVEPAVGDSLVDFTASFQDLLNAFRTTAGVTTPGTYYTVAQNGQDPTYDAVERSLDVGVVASAAPNSTIGLYAGSGTGGHARATAYTAFQAAIWDVVNDPQVISASFGFNQQTRQDSPFGRAIDQLYVDAALRNITLVKAFNDFGSSFNYANGLANAGSNNASPYALIVGGTSITTLAAAPKDPTVASTPSAAGSVYGLAMAGDTATLWRLVQGGLKQLASGVATEAERVALVEAVWNNLTIVTDPSGAQTLLPGVSTAAAGDGGVDTARPIPPYQSDYGLVPTSVNPGGQTGRGLPDVSANAGGNMFYLVPTPDMVGTQADDGTSAAAPLWASLMARIAAVFADQGLPRLGYANDLLYQAAAIAPAAFNDVTYGNDVSSFIEGGPIATATGPVTLTGYGYEAGPDYDLATGLGSPNGVLLARALSTIVHTQVAFAGNAGVIAADGAGGWRSGASQSLLFQAMAPADVTFALGLGGSQVAFESGAADAFAWTSRLAQQSVQGEFDPALTRLFDEQSQGAVAQFDLAANESLAVRTPSFLANAAQAALTSPFGFADFATAEGAVRVARPVAIATTANGQNDETAVVRLRQNGGDDLSLTLYRVDDLSGAIAGVAPGGAGYAQLAAGRAYQTTAGDTTIDGPGQGDFAQAVIADVDANDIIAMMLTNRSSGHSFWGFAQANEAAGGAPVGHLWNYGLNTWGFEDLYGGGDRDFNDLVVQLDFTSTAGSGWLA
jgi:hypothetical protein